MTDQTNDAEELRPQLIEAAQARLAENRQRLSRLRNTMLGKGHVVAMPGNLYLSLTTEPLEDDPSRCRIASYTVTPDAGQASQLAKEDAKAVAASTTNGYGETGVAIHITTALAASIEHDIVILRSLGVTDAEET